MFFELGDECSKLGFVIRQSTIEQALAGGIKCHGVMCSFANVDTDEGLDAILRFDACHRYPSSYRYGRPATYSSQSRHPRYERPRSVPGPAPISDHRLPTRPGDNTPGSWTTGGLSHAGPSWLNLSIAEI